VAFVMDGHAFFCPWWNFGQQKEGNPEIQGAN
jgi:hypothetical protein